MFLSQIYVRNGLCTVTGISKCGLFTERWEHRKLGMYIITFEWAEKK